MAQCLPAIVTTNASLATSAKHETLVGKHEARPVPQTSPDFFVLHSFCNDVHLRAPCPNSNLSVYSLQFTQLATRTRPQTMRYFLLHKPRGCITSTVDDTGRGRPTVYDVAKAAGDRGLMIGGTVRISHSLSMYNYKYRYRISPLTLPFRIPHPFLSHCQLHEHSHAPLRTSSSSSPSSFFVFPVEIIGF